MRTSLVLACSALAAVALAAPAHKRDIVWVTDYTEIVETTFVVTTVYVTAPESTALANPATSAVEAAAALDTTAAAQAAAIPAPAITSAAQAPVAVQPAPAVTASVAPAPVAATPAPEPAPASSVVESPAPSPVPIPVPAPAPATAETPASSSTPPSSGGSSAGDYAGDITFYDVGMGSCGIVSTPTDNVVALSYLIMSPSNPGNPNNNPNCGKTINIIYQGKTTQAKVVDTCAGCEGKGDLDMSYGLFGTVTGDEYPAGRIHDVSWSFAN